MKSTFPQISLLLLSFVLTFSSCEERETLSAEVLQGEVLDGLTMAPLENIKVATGYDPYVGSSYFDTLKSTFTDSMGKYTLNYWPDTRTQELELTIHTMDSFNWKGNLFTKYSDRQISSPIERNEFDFPHILFPQGVVSIEFKSNPPLASGDSLVVYFATKYPLSGFATRRSKFNSVTLPASKDFLISASDTPIGLSWRLKRAGAPYEYFTDSIVCLPFTGLDYTLEY